MSDTSLTEDVQKLEASLGQLPEPVVRPAFIILIGLPGTGKSYFCRRLAERVPLAVLASDVLRKVLFTSPTYCQSENFALFRATYKLIEVLLSRGISTILDATNLEEVHRERLYRTSERTDARLILVSIEAPPEVVYDRLSNRAKEVGRVDCSEADWQVYQRMRQKVDKIRRNYFVVDTSRDIMPVIGKIERELNRG